MLFIPVVVIVSHHQMTTIIKQQMNFIAAFDAFDENNVTIILSGNSVIIESNGLPNHTSPYWSNTTARTAVDPMGNILETPASASNHSLFVEPASTKL